MQFADFQRLLRRDRDSNPGYLAVQRFSRPPQSTTLPPLQTPFGRLPFRKRCKGTVFFETCKLFPPFFYFFPSFFTSRFRIRVDTPYYNRPPFSHSFLYRNPFPTFLRQNILPSVVYSNLSPYLCPSTIIILMLNGYFRPSLRSKL